MEICAMGRMEGRAVIVTGAARGIGRAIAEALVIEGANVAFADIDDAVKETALRAADDNRKGGSSGRTLGIVVDVADRRSFRSMIDEVVKTFGRLDVTFNNAGVNKPMGLLDVTEDNFNWITKVNTLGVLIGMQETAKQMISEGHGGKIINTASVASRQGFANNAAYCASKFGVLAFIQSGARELAKHDITVNGFAPGVVDTPLWRQIDKDLMAMGTTQREGQAFAEYSAGILRGRPATPADLVGTTTFLASSDSDYMTGQLIMIDGGMVLV
jgi:meso-butanediol dehydrogenase / (S,S)-butanediol dehydrogenase / diacetyl reductase